MICRAAAVVCPGARSVVARELLRRRAPVARARTGTITCGRATAARSRDVAAQETSNKLELELSCAVLPGRLARKREAVAVANASARHHDVGPYCIYSTATSFIAR